ncbi:MAG: Hsp70 family protein [Planctomycetota bacterium]|nr:Hsp70 family protein [Planctomycetota bacterium]
MYIVIELGTWKSACAYADVTGRPVVVTSPWGESSIPTVISLSDSGPLIGTEAIQAAARDPSRCIRYPKRKIGTDDVVNVGPDGKEWRARDCYQLFASVFKDMVERKTGEVVDTVVLTVPAGYNDAQIREDKEAAEKAGLTVLLVVREPTAFAVSSDLASRGSGHVAILDVGGGTTDGTVLKVSGNNLDILGTGGVPNLGGCDFTARIEKAVIDKFRSEHGFVPDPVADALDMLNLSEQAERAKIILSRCPTATIVFTCRGHTTRMDISQADFEHLCADLGAEVVGCLTRTLADCKLRPSDLREVLMVGGASQMPMIGRLIDQEPGIKPTFGREPLYGAAMGAVTMGLAELARRGQRQTVSGILIPAPDLFVQEVTAHPLGVTVVNPGDHKLVHSVVLECGRPYPCDVTRRFQLAVPGQTEVRIELLQGDPDAPRKNCRVLGCGDMRDLPAIADRSHVIEIRVRIDASGVVWVTARDVESGKTLELTADPRKVSQAS